MSTIGLSSWAADLKDIAAVYPFQGTEVLMVIAAVAFWLYWHLSQFKAENHEASEIVKKYGSKQKLKEIVDNRNSK